jgi:opacity protein-like surface antigen
LPVRSHVTRLLLAALFTACLSASAAAQVVKRNIPADAQRGTITGTAAALIEIDGKTFRLAPGARILNQRNLTVTPNMVAPGTLARYALAPGGEVRAVWLIDADDRANTGPVERAPATR